MEVTTTNHKPTLTEKEKKIENDEGDLNSRNRKQKGTLSRFWRQKNKQKETISKDSRTGVAWQGRKQRMRGQTSSPNKDRIVRLAFARSVS